MTRDDGMNVLLPTNEDTVGPYFPIYFGDNTLEDLSRVHPGLSVRPGGQSIVLDGGVFDRHGDLASGVLLEFWQANAHGVYRTPANADHTDLDPWFYGFGRIRTSDGRFKFRTIKPGAVAGRAPTITITIFSDGIHRVVTQVFFEDEAANATDPLLLSLPEEERERLVARPDGPIVDGAEVYHLDIIMAGDGETPFFDDRQS